MIIDIGANEGQKAIRYRGLFPNARIFSFEPVPDTFQILRSRCVGDQQVETIQAAVSDECSTAPMYIVRHNVGNSLLKPVGHWTETKATITVRTITVDEFCEERGIDSIDILKVDAEGSESAVFRGAEGLFRKRAIRNVFTEVYFNPLYSGMPLFADLDAILKAKGFRLHGIYSLTPSYEGYVLGGNAFYRLADYR